MALMVESCYVESGERSPPFVRSSKIENQHFELRQSVALSGEARLERSGASCGSAKPLLATKQHALATNSASPGKHMLL